MHFSDDGKILSTISQPLGISLFHSPKPWPASPQGWRDDNHEVVHWTDGDDDDDDVGYEEDRTIAEANVLPLPWCPPRHLGLVNEDYYLAHRTTAENAGGVGGGDDHDGLELHGEDGRNESKLAKEGGRGCKWAGVEGEEAGEEEEEETGEKP